MPRHETLVRLLRRASEALAPTRRHLADDLAVRADIIDRLAQEAKERCADLHRLGCACVVLAAINEPEGG